MLWNPLKPLLAAPFVLVLAAPALAWRGDGHRPGDLTKIAVDIAHSRRAEASNGSVVIDQMFSNRNGKADLICDVRAQITARRGSDLVSITTYVDKRIIKAYREFRDRFVFDPSEGGPDYVLDKSSQIYQASCLLPSPGEKLADIPAPHSKCDPDFEACDWTCRAAADDPDRCDQPTRDWFVPASSAPGTASSQVLGHGWAQAPAALQAYIDGLPASAFTEEW